MIQKTLLLIIKIYQLTFSPDHGVFKGVFKHFNIGCRFYPSCSEYAKEAILKKGVLEGSFLAAKRVGRCHPFSAGGFDPLK